MQHDTNVLVSHLNTCWSSMNLPGLQGLLNYQQSCNGQWHIPCTLPELQDRLLFSLLDTIDLSV